MDYILFCYGSCPNTFLNVKLFRSEHQRRRLHTLQLLFHYNHLDLFALIRVSTIPLIPWQGTGGRGVGGLLAAHTSATFKAGLSDLEKFDY